MTTWSHGYVADSAYAFSYQAEQAPGQIAMACAMAGVLWRPPPQLTVLDIGCGRGLTTNILAAANPGWTALGLDYNPAHIADAQDLAQAAALPNAGFIEADLARLTDAEIDQLPAIDIATLHGVWTWVADEVRQGILRLLSRRLKPGGVVYVGYNVQPTFGRDAGMQRLFRHLAAMHHGPARERAGAAVEQLRLMARDGLTGLQQTPLLRRILDADAPLNLDYLAHELLTEHWRPVFHEDLRAAFATAKLDFVGSATLHENMPDMLFEAADRQAHNALGTDTAREFLKDLCLQRPFRRDIYIRGARPTDRDRALDALVLLPVAKLPAEPPVLRVPVGQASLTQDIWTPIATALAHGPQPLGLLRRLPEQRQPNAAELLVMLEATNLVRPALRESAPLAQTQGFNRALVAHALGRGEVGANLALASPVLGAGLPCGWLEAAVATQPEWQEGRQPTTDDLLHRLLPRIPPGEESDQARASLAAMLADRAPVWRRAGIIPGGDGAVEFEPSNI